MNKYEFSKLGALLAVSPFIVILANLKRRWKQEEERIFIERVCIGGPMDR